ncbi:kelch-like protein 8 [Biomphalaria pfeifferi]|uniref:Kelch-like protein 8 n=1 Tax=Biomphalaria pfeifferi TaxID=112525 RepID=A0AAD8EVI5_BIOPF|nr:kelch-like protein 8 [Biomphalaria pfeifferi]
MAYKINISQGIVHSIGTFWKRHEDEDFEVKIEGETIRCHIFILASCSEFFGSLLRSSMREKREMTVDLQNISLNIFQLILKTLYTGCELLTKDNVMEVWSAVHRLQIHFLVQHCEVFVLKNISLETLETYKKQAEFLQSEKVSEGVFKYMLENFMNFRKTKAFLRLDFEEVLKLIESDSLAVISEDLVLLSVYEWINHRGVSIPMANNATLSTSSKDLEVTTHSSQMDYSFHGIEAINVSVGGVNELKDANEENKPNDVSNSSLIQVDFISSVNQKDGAPSASSQCQDNPRNVYLLPLLKATRYFLLSEACIATLHRNKTTQNNTGTIEFFLESLAYKTYIHVNGYVPPPACHRIRSSIQNVGVVCLRNHLIVAYSFIAKQWCYFPESTQLNVFQLLVLNKVLYACVNHLGAGEVFALQNQKWFSVLKIQQEIRFFFSHETCMYIITTQDSLVYEFTPFSTGYKIEADIGAVDFALSFGREILVFTTSDLKTTVRSWDTDNNSLAHIIDLDFTARKMSSFSDDRATYILDVQGRLYELKQLETIQFSLIDRLWSFRAEELNGAVLFKKVLIVCGKFPENQVNKPNVQDIVSSIQVVTSPAGELSSNFVSYTAPKTGLKYV